MSVEEKVRERMAEKLGLTTDHLGDSIELRNLVVDSFGMVDLVIELQESFDVLLHQEDLLDLKTVGQLLALIATKYNASQKVPHAP